MVSVKQECIKYHFWVFGMTQPGMEPRSPGPLMNTLPPRSYIYIELIETADQTMNVQMIEVKYE